MGENQIVTNFSPQNLNVSSFRFLTDTCMYDDIFQEFYTADSDSQKIFKTFELKGDMPEETFITEIIDDMISYIQEW